MKSWTLKAPLLFVAFLMLFASLGAAQDAVVGTVREEPGATLLLPYFEVDLTRPLGRTTRYSINNASATAVLAHVTVWTEMSVPVVAFNVYLTGYDVQSVDMRDVLNGNLPQTASAGQDPIDAISPKGNLSQDINYASCTGQLPLAPLDGATVAAIQSALTGAPSAILGGQCGARPSPGTARGYVTIDTVNNCTVLFPNNPSYQTADLTFQNVLWGDFSIGDETESFQGTPLVAIVSNLTDPATNTSDHYTFYGRYNGWTAVDHRAPLATGFLTRYKKNSTFLLTWRDPKVDQGPFACGGVPSWFPLGQEGVVFFDESEHLEAPPPVIPVAPQAPHTSILPFPAAAQRTLVGVPRLPVPFASGWVYLDLNTTVTPAGSNPASDPAASQSWVVAMDPIRAGTATVGLVGSSATQLDSAINASHYVPPNF